MVRTGRTVCNEFCSNHSTGQCTLAVTCLQHSCQNKNPNYFANGYVSHSQDKKGINSTAQKQEGKNGVRLADQLKRIINNHQLVLLRVFIKQAGT